MHSPFDGITLDSRPMFNGEYRAFMKILRLMPGLNNFVSIGAREDNFYLDLLYDKKCVLVEPDTNHANKLERYIRDWAFNDKYVERHGVHPSHSSVKITEYGSVFTRKSFSETKQAIDSGLIICPHTKHEIEKGAWHQGTYNLECSCITPRDLMHKYSIMPEFIKIDVEGAEAMIIKALMLERAQPTFIQYEYGATWFHAEESLTSLFACTPDYYHYVITPTKMNLVTNPAKQYFYANFIASRFFLGEDVPF